MSSSLTTMTSNNPDVPSKRRRTSSIPSANGITQPQLVPQNPTLSAEGSTQQGLSPISPQPSSTHIPKRGARACTACRKGKNRCEGEPPCRRCRMNNTPCIFEKPEKKASQPLPTASIERLTRLEGQYMVMQSQMIGMQSSLDRILSAIQMQAQPNNQQQQQPYQQSVDAGPSRESNLCYQQRTRFPPLPGFAPLPHKHATYGLVPSTVPSSDDESEDTLPRTTIDAPIEALQGLANAAAEAAAAPCTSSPIAKKRPRPEPIPRSPFPHVIEKGLVSEDEARQLFNIFFTGCHLFVPLFDPNYDTFESLMERTPWTFDSILAISSKVKSGNGPLTPTFYKCLEEAQGIARSSLFGPVVRKEAVMGMLLLAAWSANGWLPSGHAMRMALDLGLHRALDKLADNSGNKRSEEEERDLVVAARIWLCLYWFDHQMSLGTGRPILLRDESSVKNCRTLLTHRMASPTDIRLVSMVELIGQKTQIYETLATLNGHINHNTLAFVRRANVALDKWFSDCDELYRQAMDEESLLRRVLVSELHYAKLWLVCVALRDVSWDKMSFEQRELAFQAKDAAFSCLSIFLDSAEYRAALRYAVHDILAMLAFSGLFLLKVASLFHSEVDIAAIIGQVEQLAQLLSGVAAERYALALRIMLTNLRRKLGMIPVVQNMPPPVSDGIPAPFVDPQISQSVVPSLTAEELRIVQQGNDFGPSKPSAIPLWLQEQSLDDLGLPANGSDGIFVTISDANEWFGGFVPVPEAW
ncbi:hypothetical protein EDC04DRAFT_2632148 [Pisolithus marmoratus]|nr:hypothetical protein EDC04DRAFT_2632148 [Pisolithus marmoratus]